jgi:hypothetical protein
MMPLFCIWSFILAFLIKLRIVKRGNLTPCGLPMGFKVSGLISFHGGDDG